MNAERRARRNQEIIDDFNARMKVPEIAVKYDLSSVSIFTIVRAARIAGQVDWDGKADSSERNHSMVSQYQSGMTMDAIAEGYDLSRERVRQILSGEGVRSRSVREINEEAYGLWVAANHDEVSHAFNLTRSINGTITSLPHHPPTWVRRSLEGRKHEVIRSNGSEKFWNRDRLIGVLTEAADGGVVTIPRYRKWRTSGVTFEGRTPPTHAVIVWMFGSWNSALAEAGLTTSDRRNNRVYSRTWSVDDAYRAVRAYSSEMLSQGRRPTFAGYGKWSHENPGNPSNTYVRVLTNRPWAEVLREATTATSA